MLHGICSFSSNPVSTLWESDSRPPLSLSFPFLNFFFSQDPEKPLSKIRTNRVMGFRGSPEGVLIRRLYRGEAGGREVKLGRLVLVCWSLCCPVWLIKASLHPLCVAAGMRSMRGGNKAALVVKRLNGTVKPPKACIWGILASFFVCRKG